MEEDRLNSAKGSLLWAVFKLQWRSYAQKKEGVCWFAIDADGNAGTRRVKFARNYKLVEKRYKKGKKEAREMKFFLLSVNLPV